MEETEEKWIEAVKIIDQYRKLPGNENKNLFFKEQINPLGEMYLNCDWSGTRQIGASLELLDIYALVLLLQLVKPETVNEIINTVRLLAVILHRLEWNGIGSFVEGVQKYPDKGNYLSGGLGDGLSSSGKLKWSLIEDAGLLLYAQGADVANAYMLYLICWIDTQEEHEKSTEVKNLIMKYKQHPCENVQAHAERAEVFFENHLELLAEE